MNKYRKYITSSVGFTFLIVGSTGIIFKFFFKNHVLEDIHGWLGIAMVTAAAFHIIQNWKSLRHHFRDLKVFALVIPIAFVVLFLAEMPAKNNGMNPRQIVHKLAEMSADKVAKFFGKDVASVFIAMKKDGLQTGLENETVLEIAGVNKKPVEMILMYFVK